MHTLITDRREPIAALCRHYGVTRLDVFGSALRSDFDTAASDIDLVVEFAPELPGSAFDRYFEFKDSLEKLFQRPVDLVELGALRSQRLRILIERAREPLYATPVPQGAQIVAFQNELAHGYASLDHATVFEAAAIKAPSPLKVLEDLLAEFPPP